MSDLTFQPKAYESINEESKLDLSIILVCWNNKEYLDPCLKSLYDTGMKNSFDVIVVDNGSTDGSQQMLVEKYPDVKVIQNSENVGLGKASNQGIEVTKGRYVLLLNNDTIVNGPSFDVMVDFLNEPFFLLIRKGLLHMMSDKKGLRGRHNRLVKATVVAAGFTRYRFGQRLM